ncbi:MAG TPA: hypothetical protein VFN56_02250 [Candidatus Saccharimonadales bacterium]|nr:hypothetical protein [Candidatus Saccharimonadales bacterium]
MQAKTTHSEQVWQSPDGAKSIWQVSLKGDGGNEYQSKTYSEAIAHLGFEGDVESYLNNRGERFVRQKHSKNTTPYSRDNDAIRAQWAIGQAINLAAVKMDKDQITLPVIEEYAKELFATVSRVKGEKVTPELKLRASKAIGMTQTAAAF